jgi:hypothetical protein
VTSERKGALEKRTFERTETEINPTQATQRFRQRQVSARVGRTRENAVTSEKEERGE